VAANARACARCRHDAWRRGSSGSLNHRWRASGIYKAAMAFAGDMAPQPGNYHKHALWMARAVWQAAPFSL